MINVVEKDVFYVENDHRPILPGNEVRQYRIQFYVYVFSEIKKNGFLFIIEFRLKDMIIQEYFKSYYSFI
jgi:hypothetical protein